MPNVGGNSSFSSYSMVIPSRGTTGTGLDQIVDYVYADNGLAGATDGRDIARGAASANSLNQLIVEAANATGAAADGKFSVAEVTAMNQYLRTKYLVEWTAMHGDDEGGEETGFHLVQNDGGTTQYRGENFINTVADGIYHMGFEIRDGRFLNEDGDANACVDQVAEWLTQFYTDRSTSGVGLDRIANLIMADAGLDARISDDDIAAGVDAANGLNRLIADALADTGVSGDGAISVSEVVALNTWLRADPARIAQWTSLHGDDERRVETGFHIVQNDGANSKFFDQNLVNTVADGIYHLGFKIENGKLLNEDGAANATLEDVAAWLTYFVADSSTTGTGLDRIVDVIKTDRNLAKHTGAADINAGAAVANEFNQIIANLIRSTNANADGWITVEDLRAMNSSIRGDAVLLARWTALHGDDEGGSETGYHLVQNDGASTQYFGKNLVNTVADGIYHMGFEIQGDRFLNEDGDANAKLSDVASWLNFFHNQSIVINGDSGAGVISGSAEKEQINAGGGDDTVNGGGGNDLIFGNSGNDAIDSGAGDDLIYGGSGNDVLAGGTGQDIFRVAGNKSAGFEGYDIYSGGDGRDTIVAFGAQVDVGLLQFLPTDSIEEIDVTGATGSVALVGSSDGNVLDFRATVFRGGVVIDGRGGDDKITGSASADTILGGAGNDTISGGGGDDSFNGGDGRDVFVFEQNWGRDTVADYRDNFDKFDLRGSGASKFADLRVEQNGADTLVTYGGNMVVLLGVNASVIGQSDFIFA